jgi:drug/metabolite transporter (DMT)-like permease
VESLLEFQAIHSVAAAMYNIMIGENNSGITVVKQNRLLYSMRCNNQSTVILLWVILVASDTVSQLLLKKGAVSGRASGDVLNYLILGGYSLYIISFIAWMLILKTTRLFIALSTSSILYITVAYASNYYMGELITPNIIIGTVLVSVGVLLLGFKKA